MLAHQRGVHLAQPQLNLLLQLATSQRPVEVVQSAFDYSEGPADGVVEAEFSEPSVEGVGWTI